MINLRVSDAVELVRKNLDELDPNGSIMLDDENGSSAEFGDNSSLNDIIARSLPEAINAVHLAAPVQLLEGESPRDEEEYFMLDVDSEGVLTFGLIPGLNFLRLVSFQAVDSNIVVTEVIGEATPEGRKQLNPYIRGRYDCQRLVQLQGWRYIFKYYSLDTSRDEFPQLASDPYSAIAEFRYIPEYSFAANTTQYKVSSLLKQNIIDCLTAKVLEIYGSQQAQVFWQKANSYLTI